MARQSVITILHTGQITSGPFLVCAFICALCPAVSLWEIPQQTSAMSQTGLLSIVGLFHPDLRAFPMPNWVFQMRPLRNCCARAHAYTIPFLNSSSGYFVPRHSMPSFHSVKNIDRSSV